MQSVRVIIAVALSLLVVGITLPAQTNLSPPAQHKCCCEHAGNKATHDGCGEPAKPTPDNQCCSGCPLAFAVLPTESKLGLFDGPDRGRFPLENLSCRSRTDRPPVPPPRGSLVA